MLDIDVDLEQPTAGVDDVEPAKLHSKHLSWDLENLNDDVGQKGFEGKINAKMVSQVLLGEKLPMEDHTF